MKIVRTLIAVLAAYFLAFYLPAAVSLSVLARYDVPVVILFAAVFGVLSFIAIERRERLKEAIATELNKLRRVYHLGKNLGTAPHLRGWFTDLHGYIYDYLGAFEKFDLADYDKGNALFRRIAYHIYTVPELREVKEQVLYNELLDATALISDARQRIATLYKSRYAKSHWFELAALVAVFVATVVSSTAGTWASEFASANILAAGFILALTFFEHDAWTREGDGRLAKEYVRNIARLELRRS
jgi:hypothetical protein